MPSCGNVQRLFRKLTWSDNHNVANPFHVNHGIKQGSMLTVGRSFSLQKQSLSTILHLNCRLCLNRSLKVFNLFAEETPCSLNYMYLPSEIPDACALSRELMEFSLKEEDDWPTQHRSVENSGCDFKSRLGLSAERKMLFQHDTVLDRKMVSFCRSTFNVSRIQLDKAC